MGEPDVVRIGSRVSYEGSLWEVADLSGGEVLLVRPGRPAAVRIRTLDLLRSDSQDRPRLLASGPVGTDGPSDLGLKLEGLADDDKKRIADRAAHMREVSTGYRSGSSEGSGSDEPRPRYLPSLPLLSRYQAKAEELGVSVPTIRRWMRAYREEGEAGLLDHRRAVAPRRLFAKIDGRWLAEAETVVADQTNESTTTTALVILRINERLRQKYGEKVKLPSRSSAYAALKEMSSGRSTFGSAKRRRSIATRPKTAGRLAATRPGEYVYMDTNSLDVFCMDSATMKWMKAELTVALDLYDRCILGLAVTPVSTRSVDAAGVLYEVMRPKDVPTDWPLPATLPYHGVPEALIFPTEKLDSSLARSPGVVPETLIVDHGKIYLSSHLMSACQQAGISIQLARPYQGSDKGPVERFFRTMSMELLNALPGYKGSDIDRRGKDVEEGSYYFFDELELIIREWIATVYHRRPHSSLVDPHIPGFELTPLQQYEIGIARAGRVRIPSSTLDPLNFLPVSWHPIHHYGVEIDKMKYKGPIIAKYKDRDSPYPQATKVKYKVRGSPHPQATHVKLWPFRINPEDRRCIYFRDPEDQSWHTLTWEHAAEIDRPFSTDALAAARRLAAKSLEKLNDKEALILLLNEWGAGLASTRAQRREAARMTRERRTVLSEALTEAGLQQISDLYRNTAGGYAREPYPTDDEDDMYAAGDELPDPDDESYYDDAVDPLI